MLPNDFYEVEKLAISILSKRTLLESICSIEKALLMTAVMLFAFRLLSEVIIVRWQPKSNFN